MIQINKKPSKKIEYFDGTITMAVAGSDRMNWKFQVLKSTNGDVKHSVSVDDATPEQQQIISATILANIDVHKIDWTE
jgi:hypothetical protein